jgi:hypothetical protein
MPVNMEIVDGVDQLSPSDASGGSVPRGRRAKPKHKRNWFLEAVEHFALDRH